MEIKFKTSGAKLNAALNVVSIVPPQVVDTKGGTGFLFVIRGQKCSLYSRDGGGGVGGKYVAKAEFDIFDVEGEGAFIYPSSQVDAFQYLVDATLSFTATEAPDGTFLVKYESSNGASAEKTAFSPSMMKTCDSAFEEATDKRTYPVSILRQGIGQTQKHVDDANAEDNFKTLQLFDDSNEEWAKGKGTIYASNSVESCYFYSDAFDGKGFAIHAAHIKSLQSFLGKASGQVEFRTGSNMTFASDSNGNTFGWIHHTKNHSKYSTYSKKKDQYVIDVVKNVMLNALQYTKGEMGASKRDKIKLHWKDNSLFFEVAESASKAKSFPVPSARVKASAEDFSIAVNINHLIRLFEGVVGNEVELRLCYVPGDPDKNIKPYVLFRTIDAFLLDADGKVVPGDPDAETKPDGTYRCKVTRFCPSMQ